MKKNKIEKLNALDRFRTQVSTIKARCKYFGECGGCLMQDVTYADQLRLKQQLVNDVWQKHEISVPIKNIIPSATQWYYRNRMDYPVGENAEIGLKPFGKWRDVLDLKECFLLSKETPEILQLVRDWMRKWNLPGWNNKRYSGYVRYVVIREGKNTGERMVMVVTAAEPEPEAAAWPDLVKRLQNYATTIVHGINARITDISIPAELRILRGQNYFTEKVNDFVYKIYPASFFQTNTAGAADLQRVVLEAVSGERVLDLYCGLGFFTIALAAQGKQALGVEIDVAAIALARENAIANKVRAEFMAMAVEDWLKQGGAEVVKEFAPDTIIIDPPRAGLHPRVVDWLVKLAAREVIYVSCNYEQFAREFAELKKAYRLESIQAIDLFPHTPHVELVIKMVGITLKEDSH